MTKTTIITIYRFVFIFFSRDYNGRTRRLLK
jgi:hypothetical protein